MSYVDVRFIRTIIDDADAAPGHLSPELQDVPYLSCITRMHSNPFQCNHMHRLRRLLYSELGLLSTGRPPPPCSP